MDKIVVQGGHPLTGTVNVEGAKKMQFYRFWRPEFWLVAVKQV